MPLTRYRIVSSRSRFWAEATSTLHPIRADTSALESHLEAEVVDGGVRLGTTPTAHVELEVERIKSGNRLFDTELQRRIEVRKFPVVKADAREVQELGNGRYRIRGEIQFHGISRALDGEVVVRVLGDSLEIEGTKQLDMRDFGLEPPVYVQPVFQVGIKVVVERAR